MASPIRILTLCRFATDTTAQSIQSISNSSGNGIEVIYLGYHVGWRHCARGDPGGRARHWHFQLQRRSRRVFWQLLSIFWAKKGADDIKVFGGGGGTYAPGRDDYETQRRGQVFSPARRLRNG